MIAPRTAAQGLTPVAGLFLTRLGFEEIFKMHRISKHQSQLYAGPFQAAASHSAIWAPACLLFSPSRASIV